MIVGKQSILFEENVYIEETACVAGQKESEGPLGKLFDVVVEDAMAGMENWEEVISFSLLLLYSSVVCPTGTTASRGITVV